MGKCQKCGNEQEGNGAFCNRCGAPVSSQKETDFLKVLQLKASDNPGEVSFNLGALVVGDEIQQLVNPFFFLLKEGKKLGKAIINSFKDKKKLIPVIILTLLWLALDILTQLGYSLKPVRVLSYLTFAEGGLHAKPFMVAGGVIGKAVIAYFLTAFILPIFKGKNPFHNFFAGIKSSKISEFNGLQKIIPILMGVGIALIFYNFLAGYATLEKTMVAVVASLLALQGVSSESGFLYGLFNSIYRKAKNKVTSQKIIKKIIYGISMGCLLAIPLSTLPFGYSCYYAGIFFLFVMVILFVINVANKGKTKGNEVKSL